MSKREVEYIINREGYKLLTLHECIEGSSGGQYGIKYVALVHDGSSFAVMSFSSISLVNGMSMSNGCQCGTCGPTELSSYTEALGHFHRILDEEVFSYDSQQIW